MSKKFTFDDLQPPAEMLIEALENKGACASGFAYNDGVKELAQNYKELLVRVRDKQRFLFLEEELDILASTVLTNAGNNQRDRLNKIVEGLTIYIKKEYYKP